MIFEFSTTTNFLQICFLSDVSDTTVEYSSGDEKFTYDQPIESHHLVVYIS